MIGKLKDLMRLAGGEWIVSFTTRDDPRKMFDQFTGKDVNIDIKKASKARTKTANDFCWALCTDIGNAMRPPVPKEEVYRKAISEVGRFELMHMQADAIPTFRDIWERRGIGWFTQVVDYSQIPGTMPRTWDCRFRSAKKRKRGCWQHGEKHTPGRTRVLSLRQKNRLREAPHLRRDCESPNIRARGALVLPLP